MSVECLFSITLPEEAEAEEEEEEEDIQYLSTACSQ
jgi:hypothetical protein